MPPRACYPGSFDPVTRGHLDLIRRAARLFDGLVVAVGRNADKVPLFTPEERVEMLEEELGDLDGAVTVETFDGLVVDFCKERKLDVILRGLRTVSDFESEFQMALTNRTFAPEIETVFAMPGEQFGFVSSRLIKEIVRARGDVGRFVTPGVARRLADRLRG